MTGSDAQALFAALAARFREERARLGELDARAGDGDHGAAMARGFAAAAETAAAHDPRDVGALFHAAGRAFMKATGGASGPLFAALFVQLGRAAAGREALAPAHLAAGLADAVALVQRMGRAEVGDKTLLDALAPAAEAAAGAQAQGAELAAALTAVAEAAREGADATRALRARRGRARWVEGGGEGHPDPGATSMALVFEVMQRAGRATNEEGAA